MADFERDPFGNDVRRNLRELRIGPEAGCVLCGYTKPEGLVPGPASLLEEHHVVGRANDPDLKVWVCRNCHAEATEGQRDAGVELSRGDRHVLERIESFLRAIADFLMRLARSAWELANQIAAHMSRLDASYPDWRAV